jgi:hypothetical protein
VSITDERATTGFCVAFGVVRDISFVWRCISGVLDCVVVLRADRDDRVVFFDVRLVTAVWRFVAERTFDVVRKSDCVWGRFVLF